jgi:hypothetical protein
LETLLQTRDLRVGQQWPPFFVFVVTLLAKRKRTLKLRLEREINKRRKRKDIDQKEIKKKKLHQQDLSRARNETSGASEVHGRRCVQCSGSLAETGRSAAWVVKGEGVFVGQRKLKISW